MNVTPVRLPPGRASSARDRCVREMRLDRTRSGSLSSPAWRQGRGGSRGADDVHLGLHQLTRELRHPTWQHRPPSAPSRSMFPPPPSTYPSARNPSPKRRAATSRSPRVMATASRCATFFPFSAPATRPRHMPRAQEHAQCECEDRSSRHRVVSSSRGIHLAVDTATMATLPLVLCRALALSTVTSRRSPPAATGQARATLRARSPRRLRLRIGCETERGMPRSDLRGWPRACPPRARDRRSVVQRQQPVRRGARAP